MKRDATFFQVLATGGRSRSFASRGLGYAPSGQSISDLMDALAQDGWCVVLKRLPKEYGWMIEGSRSEFDLPCEDKEVGKGKWLAECSDIRYIKKGTPHRNPGDAMGKTAIEALVKLTSRISEDKDRRKTLTET